MAKKRTDADYCGFDPFAGDRDVDIRNRKVKIVTTRKKQWCAGTGAKDDHDIPPGTRARFESAFVEGRPGSFYSCLACMDKMMKECGV